MRVRDFVSHLTERVDAAVARGAAPSDHVAQFVAPSSGFCGPGFRPKYMGDASPTEGRYGLTLDQSRRLLHDLTGKWPARTREEQDS